MKKSTSLLSFLCAALLLFGGCRSSRKEGRFQHGDIRTVISRMTGLMVHDVTNPPLASRFFSYACLAGYEIVAQNEKGFKSMHGVLNEYPNLQKPDSLSNYSAPLASVLAMLQTARKMQPSGSLLLEYEKQFLDSLREEGLEEEVIRNSVRYASAVSKAILAYAKSDGYNKTTNYQRYAPVQGEGAWYPTPPAYIAAVEPYFNRVRPFTLDSCAQFKPRAPVPFSADKKSPFYRMLQTNYAMQLTEEQKKIAAFWDCNPFAVQDNGHLLVGLKKISPGAHWLGISGIACEKGKKSFAESMQIYTLVSVGLMDAFICCWDEKYRSNRIRPETAIRKYIDPSWAPLLQTPPFPEYLSGHSTISAASAEILTYFFGNSFSYTDDSEVAYGLAPRNFSSFHQAADEAGLSRYYGGIHFMDAIEEGRAQGLKVGAWVLSVVKP